MSDLYQRYDRAAVADQLTQPPFAELADRGRRRAHRTRTVQLAGVAMLAALVAVPMLLLPGGSQPDTVGVPPPSQPTWDAHSIMVTFHDVRVGVAQYPGATCGEGWLAVTQDGGKTWSELRELPRFPVRSTRLDADGREVCAWPAAVPVGADTLVVAASAQPPDPAGEVTFISHDAGRTWKQYKPKTRTADSVPDGVVPHWPCDERACKEAGLGWYDAQTGDWMVLKNQPPGAEYAGMTVGFDGSLWVYGSGDGKFHVAVSRDRGRSWQDRSPRLDVEWLEHAGLTAHDADTAYLRPMNDAEPFDLYRTTDGGKTWLPVPAAQQFDDIVFVWVNRKGDLGLADRDRKQYLSTDGGATFAPAQLPVWGPFELTGGMQGWPIDFAAADPVDLYLSVDGVTWQPVQVPNYQRR
jgi:photosystem II stability/assembly factor-like uncharacterized protein